ncbi:MAG: NAD(P)H-binding protein, partial [Actinomycetes bacterium]
RASGAPYTIVRPGWFDAVGAGDDRLVLEQTDTGNGGIGRDQLAEVLVRSLLTDTAAGRTFELFAEAGPAPTDWAGLFGALTADPTGGLDAASDGATLPPVGEEPPVVQDDPARLARCPDPAGGHCQYPERQALPRRRDRELPGARPRTGRARTRASNSHVRRR